MMRPLPVVVITRYPQLPLLPLPPPLAATLMCHPGGSIGAVKGMSTVPDINMDVILSSSSSSAAADLHRVGPSIVVAAWYDGKDGMIELMLRLMLGSSLRG
jgi:hypothetical protein